MEIVVVLYIVGIALIMGYLINRYGLVGDCREDEVFRTTDLQISREGTGKFSASGRRCQ